MTKKADQKPTISCAPDGAYRVRGLKYLRNSRGEELTVRDHITLCRCGHSKKRPFCDSTHSKTDFSGERLRKSPPTAKQDRYPAEGITILDNRTVCAHIAKCTDGLPAVWRRKERPWIRADAAEPEEIIEVIRQCPSGALSYEGEPPVDRGVGITILKDGPYYVTGGFALDDPVTQQTPQDPDEYTLCRCGASKNKPFCDGAHWDIEFRDEEN